jgi:hypothetical protein
MRFLDKIKFIKLLPIILMGFILFPVSKVFAATTPNLGQAGSFSILGFESVTNANLSTISGDIGVWSGSSITGLDSITIGGATHTTDSVAEQAQTDASAATSNLLSQANTGGTLGALDSLVLVPGVYDMGEGLLNGGVLTLDGAGVYIFRTTSTLVSSGSINLINGARACDVFWYVESAATINGSSFVGTIFAKTGIHFGAGVRLNGRALAIGADVVMDSNTVTGPTCTTVTDNNSTSTSTSSNSVDSYCAPISSTLISPIIIESKRINTDSIFIKWGPYSGTDTFNIQYGFENGKFLYNTDVTGFSTTINDLKSNQPIWVRIAPRNNCQIGIYGEPKFIGSPKLPNAGFAPEKNSFFIFLNQIKNWFL